VDRWDLATIYLQKQHFKPQSEDLKDLHQFHPNMGMMNDVENSSSWVGMFVNHRPFEDSDWFRVGTGFGVGKIQNELTNTNNASDVYHANYEGNIVAYVGVGVGSRPVKGLQFGLDVGVLSTGGATVFADRDNLAPKNAILNEIEDDSFFGSLLPNVQLNISWGF
jgi:hypothetical protein